MTVLDQFRLDGKCILVTGGSRGFGRAIALAAAEAGADVMLVARDPDALARTADEVRERGRKAWTFVADIAEPTACEDLCRRALSEGPPIDILVNNVGGRNVDVAIEDSDLATWRRFIDLNLTHCFICTKMIGGAMLARGQGRVINIASISGMIANRGIGGRHYETAKAAVIHFTRATAADWAPRGVTVNAICPGLFMTEPNKAWAKKNPAGDRNVRARGSDGSCGRARGDRPARGLSRLARFELCHWRRFRDRRRLYALVARPARSESPWRISLTPSPSRSGSRLERCRADHIPAA